MTIAPEILAAQAEYAARPYFVMWRDSHCQVPARFNTLAEAFSHIDYCWSRIKATVERDRYSASNLGFRGRNGSWIEGPGIGFVPLGYLLMTNNVSSY